MDRCKSVITIPQFTGTCWFNALLMALLYSDGTRQYLLKNLINSELFIKNRELYAIIMDILKNKHRKMDDNDTVFFNELKPEKILKLLHSYDKDNFYFDPDKFEGHWGEYYFIRLFEYFGMKKKVVYLYIGDYKFTDENFTKMSKSYYYSPLNNKPYIEVRKRRGMDGKLTDDDMVDLTFPVNVKKIKYTNHCFTKEPDIIIVTRKNAPDYTDIKNLVHPPITLESDEIQEVILFHDNLYKIDSLLISNFNTNTCTDGHQIAGVSCDNKRYIYNGWIRDTKDPAKSSNYLDKNVPCELMKYDWLLNKDDFCLSPTECQLDRKTAETELCFNTSKIENNTYIYVKVDDDMRVLKLLRDNLKKTSKNCDKELKLLKNQLDTDTSNLDLFNKQLNDKKKSCEEHIKEIEDRIFNIETSKSPNKKSEEKNKQEDLPKKKENASKKEKICKEDQVLNKLTNRCVKRTGVTGKKIVEEEEEGKTKKESTKKESTKKESTKKESTKKESTKKESTKKESTKKESTKKEKICKEDQILNKKTNRCVKRTGLTGKLILENMYYT